MNERLKELAVQAGLYYKTVSGKNYDLAIERFADLVRQDEREACAKVCEELSKANWTFCNFAEAIRARGEK
jgi:hypothetical protein